MYLNGYYIRFVDSWDKQTKGEIKTSADAKYIKPKAENEIRVTHKIKGIVNHEGTANELQEMFANPNYNIAVISECDVPEYNGVYNLDKGNIIRDGGLATWGVELWLSNKTNSIRYSQYTEDYNSETSYLQTQTSDYTDIENYEGTATNDGSNGFYTEDTMKFGYSHWNSFVAEYEIDVQRSGAVAHYKLNGDYTDSSGNGNDIDAGDIYNSPTFTTGKIGNGILFADGINDRFYTPFNSWVDTLEQQFAISAWVNVQSTWDTSGKGNNSYIIGNSDTYGGSWGIHKGVYSTKGVGFYMRSNSSEFIYLEPDDNPTDIFQHVVLVGDGYNIKFYKNNQLMYIKSRESPDVLDSFQTNVFQVGGNSIAGGSGGDREVNAIVDDVRFYKVPLDDNDVAFLYNNGSGTEEQSEEIVHRYEFNLIENYNRNTATNAVQVHDKSCYQVELKRDGTIRLNKVFNYVTTKLAEATVSVTDAVGTYDKMKIAYSNGKCDIYFNDAHVMTYDVTDMLSGRHAFFGVNDSVKIKNFSVKQLIPMTHAVSTKEENLDYVLPISYINTREGLLRNYVNTEEEVVTDVYPSRVFTGDVKVWDTMDNDFHKAYTPLMPLCWRRVYDPSHEFKGHMFIENGLFGILYTPTEILHYVYDKQYRKGTRTHIDFKQNPNKEVWNSPYKRNYEQTNGGQSNWTEDGLDFKNTIPQDKTIERITNTKRDPHLTEALFSKAVGVGRLDAVSTREGTERLQENYQDGWYGAGTIISHDDSVGANMAINNNQYSDTTTDNFDFRLDEVRARNPSALDGVPIQKREITYIQESEQIGTQDEVLIYEDGMLIHKNSLENQSADTYYDALHGYVNIGNAQNADAPYRGNIEKATYSVTNQGKVDHKSLYEPILWHSFDEEDWDYATTRFQDRSSTNGDFLTMNGTPEFRKNGRFNECLYFEEGDYMQTGTAVNLGTRTSGFSIQFYFRFDSYSTPSGDSWHHIFHCDSQTTGAKIEIRVRGKSNGDHFFDIYMLQDDGSYIYLFTTANYSGLSEFDNRWHHAALVWEGNASGNAQFYVDGEIVVEHTGGDLDDTFTFTSSELKFGSISNSDLNLHLELDELLIHSIPVQPQEFGVYSLDTYDTGQWYTKAEFEQLSNGTWRRKDNAKIPSFELEITPHDYPSAANRVTSVQGALSSSQVKKGIATSAGKVGLGICNTTVESDGGAGMYFNGDDEDHLRLDEQFTLQFYYDKSRTPNTNSLILYLRSVESTITETTPYIRVQTNNKIDLYMDGATYSTTYDNSFALSDHEIYHIALVWDYPNREAHIYVDQVLYYSYALTKIVEAQKRHGIYRHIAIGISWNEWEGNISNLSIHREILSTSEMGIFADTKTELPRLYGRIRNQSNADGISSGDFTKFRIKSISPDLVEVDIYDSLKLPVKTSIESGSYFYKLNKEGHLYNTSNFNGLKYDFYDLRVEHSNFKYWVGATKNNIKLRDLAVLGTSYLSDDNEFVIGAGNRFSKMLFVATTSTAGLGYDHEFYMAQHSSDHTDYMLIDTNDGITNIGYIPQMYVNDTYFPVTATDDTLSSTVDTTTEVSNIQFVSRRRGLSGTYTSIALLKNYMNDKLWENGCYLVAIRGRPTSSRKFAVLPFINAKRQDSQYNTSTANAYTTVYALVDIKEGDTNIYMGGGSFDVAGGGAYYYLDYFFILPLTNGRDMPLDFIRQSLIKRFKTKVVE